MALQKYIFEVDLVLVEKDQTDRTGRGVFLLYSQNRHYTNSRDTSWLSTFPQ